MTFFKWCKCISIPDPNPYVFGPPRSAFRSVIQRYESADPEPHPDPYQTVTDPQHWRQLSWLLLESEAREIKIFICKINSDKWLREKRCRSCGSGFTEFENGSDSELLAESIFLSTKIFLKTKIEKIPIWNKNIIFFFQTSINDIQASNRALKSSKVSKIF